MSEPITQDFGSSELNEVYANLDGPTKEKLDKIKNEKVKINLLKDISNPELNDLFNKLSAKTQKEYEDFGIRDKYLMLKELLKRKKENVLKPPSPTDTITDYPHLLKDYKKMPNPPPYKSTAYDLSSDDKPPSDYKPSSGDKSLSDYNYPSYIKPLSREAYKLSPDNKTLENIQLFTVGDSVTVIDDMGNRNKSTIYKVYPDNDKIYDVTYDEDGEIVEKVSIVNIKPSKTYKKAEEQEVAFAFSPDSPYQPYSSNKEDFGFMPRSPQDSPPEDIFEKEDKEIFNKKEQSPPQILFDNLVKTYYASNPHIFNSTSSHELEVRFGTKGIKKLTRSDYDNVIKKLKSLGFNCINESGNYSLKIQNEFLDKNRGVFEVSNIRAEINGLTNIQEYCKGNDIYDLVKKNADIVFTRKNNVLNEKKEKIRPVNFDDFNFRVSYQTEERMSSTRGSIPFIISNWRTSKKMFRYLNRVTFVHELYPILVDISIVKQSDMVDGKAQKYYTTDEAGVFDKSETYEIELEIDNKRIGPGTKFNNYNIILESLRSVIKIVLGGLQGTNFPISYPEQRQVLESYMKMLHTDNYNPKKPVYSSDFIGPSSFTLQLENVSPINDNSVIPNVRKDFVVTDKADGDRHLLYVNETGKIYLINTNMKIIFTGAKTNNEETFNSLIDGELISHDKDGKFINLYAAFDIYYKNKIDFRKHPFMPNYEKEKEKSKSKKDEKDPRFLILKSFVEHIDIVSILQPNEKQTGLKSIVEKVKKSVVNSPLRIMCKKFYPENFNSSTSNIFDGCNTIISKLINDLFEYTTDGLIFTHAFYGVGANTINDCGPLSKITWEYSFKWKPPQFNTIDFLVTTVKNKDNSDVVKNLFEDGVSASASVQLNSYKQVQLRCSFNEKRHGFINPCQDVIDDNLPEYKNFEDKSDRESKPVQFYPTSPYDPTAGICNLMLKDDGNNNKQMFSEEGEMIDDNTIVEFSYDLDGEQGWRWIPLRVRYDKTTEMRQGAQQFGNAYHVANDNWKSIHYPVTEEMIRSGINIPDTIVDEDVYYNVKSKDFKTEGLKNFHNLYVKKLLIKSVSKQGDTLIDFACGKAGDLPKWIAARLAFVFGVDISKDNLENRLDGACARFLKARRQNKSMPYALFVNGNSAFNIKNGSAMLNDKAIQITNAVFGNGTKESDKIGKGVSRQYGKGAEGFNVSSCQFALHYFWENPTTLQGFMRNLSECTKLNGYFIGTAYDGKEIFKMLKKKAPGESVQIIDDGKKIWEIVKGYKSETFEDDSSSIGYRIDVYQESINQLLPEFLINFDYLNRIMELYGFKLVDRDEAQNLGLPEATGLFSELFMTMIEEIKRNKYKENDLGNATKMSEFEKKISFLNRYFVYKKIRHVNEEKIEIELGEYQDDERVMNQAISKSEVDVEKESKPSSKKSVVSKIRKLNTKLVLIPATEALEEKEVKETKKRTKKAAVVADLSNLVLDINTSKEPTTETKEKETKKPRKITKKATKLIIEDEDE